MRCVCYNILLFFNFVSLSQEDLRRRPRIAKMLATIVQYDSGVVPNPKKGKKNKKKVFAFIS